MKKGYKKKKRNEGNRMRKRIILLSLEGNNKTEKIYFKHFNSESVKINFAKGNYTDPENMMAQLLEESRDLDMELGDRAYCLVDGDLDLNKNKQIESADKMAKENNIELILSNPCFEVWYICHFTNNETQYKNNDEVIKVLRKFIPYYEKNIDIFDEINDKVKVAIDSAKYLEERAKEKGKLKHQVDYLPTTEVYKIVKRLEK